MTATKEQCAEFARRDHSQVAADKRVTIWAFRPTEKDDLPLFDLKAEANDFPYITIFDQDGTARSAKVGCDWIEFGDENLPTGSMFGGFIFARPYCEGVLKEVTA